MGEGVTFVDRDGVGNTVSGVEDETGSSSGGVEGENGLNGKIVGGDFKGFKHDFCHFLSVGFGISGG